MKVYKYRSTKDLEILERDLNTFSNNSFYAPKLDTFPDKLEANFKEQITTIVDFLGKLSSLYTRELKYGLKEVTTYKEKIGFYCVTKTYQNDYLWENYANFHKGYCIEYELERLTDKSKNIDFSNLLEVKYDNETPVLQIDDINQNTLISKMFGIKQMEFLPEDELRLIFNSASLKKHHESTITAIYFGHKAEESLKQIFYKKFENRDLKFYEIIKTKTSLERKLINEFKRKLKFDLDKYNFEILIHNVNEHLEIFDVYFIGEFNTEILRDFALAFEEKNCHKLCNIHIYNNREIVSLIGVYPLPDNDYIKFADSYIAIADFSCEDILFEFPYKNFKYNELKNK